MYPAHTSALPFKVNRLRSQATTCASTLVHTSNQFRSSWRPGPNHTPRMRTGPSLQRKGHGRGNASPPGTQPQTFALVKVDLGTCYLFVTRDRLLHRQYVPTPGHKDRDIIGERGNLRSDAAA